MAAQLSPLTTRWKVLQVAIVPGSVGLGTALLIVAGLMLEDVDLLVVDDALMLEDVDLLAEDVVLVLEEGLLVADEVLLVVLRVDFVIEELVEDAAADAVVDACCPESQPRMGSTQ